MGLGSRQNSYWILLSVMLTNVQTHTHTDTQTRTYRRTDIQTVSSWGFISCEPHKVTPYVHKTNHKIQISLRQFKPKVTELQVKGRIIVIGKHSQHQTRSSQKRSITSTPQYLPDHNRQEYHVFHEETSEQYTMCGFGGGENMLHL